MKSKEEHDATHAPSVSGPAPRVTTETERKKTVIYQAAACEEDRRRVVTERKFAGQEVGEFGTDRAGELRWTRRTHSILFPVKQQ
ncbi:uncharacterized [Tachysurus ichikawai]